MPADRQWRTKDLRGRFHHLGTALAILLSSACGGDGPSEPPSCDTMVLGVTPAAAPSFSWLPSHCGIYVLTVTHDSAGAPVGDWLVEGDGNSILPPVEYGIRPATALPFCGLFCPLGTASPLSVGRRYTVSLSVEIPHSGGGPIMQLVGSTTFVP